MSPRKYIRKVSDTLRCTFSEEELDEAIRRVQAGEISKRESERRYGVPVRTLERRIAKRKTDKNRLGPDGILGRENEKRLVTHIQNLAACGFPLSRIEVRRLAFQFAERMGIPHKFNKESETAGYDWLKSFLERNPELSIRQSEGLSLARAQGMNRIEVNQFFDILEQVLLENNLLQKPSNIFNMDESGMQLNNKPSKVITKKGSKDVHVLTAKEKGENVTVVACCSADGKYIPPVLIFKGVNQKAEFSDGLPPGSNVYMNRKSSYINSELFIRWLKEQFIPNKPFGKVLLILDGHSSHCNDILLLETAQQNDIILLCLPSHCTQALQPLDRSFFGPLKTYFKNETNQWMRNHPNRTITRYQAGQLIGRAWLSGATVGNAVSGFEATGIYPLNRNRIPDHFFTISDEATIIHHEPQRVERETTPIQDINNITILTHTEPRTSTNSSIADPDPSTNSSITEPGPCTSSSIAESGQSIDASITEPGPSAEPSIAKCGSSIEILKATKMDSYFSPTKHLLESSPIPKIPLPLNKRLKQHATVLTSTENIEKRKNTATTKGKKKIETKSTVLKTQKTKEKVDINKKRVRAANTWSEDDDEPLILISKKREKMKRLLEHQDNDNGDDDTYCLECYEKYCNTKKSVDWIQCITCKLWLHETCSLYPNQCNICGREDLRLKNTK